MRATFHAALSTLDKQQQQQALRKEALEQRLEQLLREKNTATTVTFPNDLRTLELRLLHNRYARLNGVVMNHECHGEFGCGSVCGQGCILFSGGSISLMHDAWSGGAGCIAWDGSVGSS